MSGVSDITDDEVDVFYKKLKKQIESVGYHLNPDVDFTKELLRSIIVNEKRYGYGACPCRLASGDKTEDYDIVCPCDYRDPDLTDYGACYCGLYVSGKILSGEDKLTSIPERRPSPDERVEERAKLKAQQATETISTLKLPVWRCKVCGYLCAREEPPEICPICKVSKVRFERFI
jgi:ferredoxin-thioredoxin reductase catalytic subunit/rubredoxin